MTKSPSEKAFADWFNAELTSTPFVQSINLDHYSASAGWVAGVKWATSKAAQAFRDSLANAAPTPELAEQWRRADEAHRKAQAVRTAPKPIPDEVLTEVVRTLDTLRAEEREFSTHLSTSRHRTQRLDLKVNEYQQRIKALTDWLRESIPHQCPECSRLGDPIGTVQPVGVTNYRCVGCGHHFAE